MQMMNASGTKRSARSQFWRAIAATVVIAGLATMVAHAGNTAMAAGIVTGGGGAVAAILVAGWLYRRRRGDVATGARVLAGPVDERDAQLVSHSWAITGCVVVGGLVVELLAKGMGADVTNAPAILLWVALGTLAVSFVVLDRRS
jgi:hypothetical protein